MTIPNQSRRTEALGNDSTPTYNYTWKAQDKNDVAVYLLPIATGVEVKLILDTDYTVAGPFNQDAGGTYTVINAAYLNAGNLPTGDIIVAIGGRVDDQTTSYRNQSSYLPQRTEDSLDDRTVVAQQTDEILARTLKLQVTNTVVNPEFPIIGPNEMFAMDSAGTAVEGKTASQILTLSTTDSLPEGSNNLYMSVSERAQIVTNQTGIATNVNGIGTNASNIGTNATNIANNVTAIATAQAAADAGTDKQLQFKDGANAAGAADLLYDKTTGELNIEHLKVNGRLGMGASSWETAITPGSTLNDFLPQNFQTQSIFYMYSIGSGFTITGFDASASDQGRIFTLINVGIQDILFANFSASSLPDNRMSLPEETTITLKGGCGITFVYDINSSPDAWRVVSIGQQPGTGGGGGGVTSVNGDSGPAVVLDTGDISDIVDKRYLTDAELADIGNNTTSIGANATNIGTNATNIGTNATDIGNNTTSIGTNATNIGTNVTGIADRVVGPVSSVDEAVARMDGATGKIIQGYTSNAPTISDVGELTLDAQVKFSQGTAILRTTADTSALYLGGGNGISVANGALIGLNGAANNGRAELYAANVASGEVRLLTGNAITQLAITQAGQVNITNGLAVGSLLDLSAAGAGQIEFPATQNPSANVNTLDDYEEGTWTPTIQDNTRSDGEGQTYAIQVGTYTKVGNLVTYMGSINMLSDGTLTGTDFAVLAGLPFLANNTSSLRNAVCIGDAGGMIIDDDTALTGEIRNGESYVRIGIWNTTAGTSQLTIAQWSQGDMVFTGSYTI